MYKILSDIKKFFSLSVFFAFMLYAIWVIVFAYVSYYQDREKLNELINQQLVNAALTISLLLPKDLHHKGLSKNDLTGDEDHANTLSLSEYTDKTQITYVYTLILRDNKIFFTSSSATKEERDKEQELTSFFEHYDDVDPRVYDAFSRGEKVFLEYTDQWGNFRSVFIPQYSNDGTLYLAAADLSIAYIQNQLDQQIYQSILESLLFIAFATPIYFVSVKKVNRVANKLKVKVKKKSSQLELSEERHQLFARIYNEAHEGVTITDINGRIIDVNPTFCEITGFSREEVIGKKISIVNQGKQIPEFYSEMWPALKQHHYWQGEVWSKKKEGEVYAQLLSVSALKDDYGKTIYYVGLFADITLSKRQQESLELMAHYDVLTQLPNRTLFADRFIHLSSHCKRVESLLAVCFLDVDNFKPVNDNYGHKVGDQLLIELAERIKMNIREEDTVSRQGGDEFVLLLGELESFTQCELMLERLLSSISQPYIIDGCSHKISASVGVTLYPIDDADLDTLVRHADKAMYQAKLAGKNGYQFFNVVGDMQIIKKHKRIQEIQQAFSNHEFCLFYQPKVNMKTGEVLGVEALIRWMHPQKGLIAPLDFLPIIENSQLEIQIGEWVIHEALKQLDYWKKQGTEFEISVNISPYHLQARTFISQMDKLLAEFPDINSQNFQLEILETSSLGDLNAISSTIKTCRNALGVGIALDDFGTGYSSLTHLRNLFANTIKIDRSFVRDVLDDPGDFSIIDGVIGLANSFNRKIVAEGVESTEHGLILLIMGCDEAQGYSIAHPMPAESISSWLHKYTPNKEWITFVNSVPDQKEMQIKLFKLTVNQWIKRFQANIESSSENIEYWPIMATSKCHCGNWISRATKEHQFKQSWLGKLDEVHEEMHHIALELLLKFQDNDKEAIRKKMNTLETVLEELDNVIAHYDEA